MDTLRVSLFHRLRVHYSDIALNVEGRKAQELFCYLILFRGKAHTREALADQLWDELPADQSRRYLRKTLWQLQSAVETHGLKDAATLLTIEPEWVQISPHANLWLDAGILEQTYLEVQGRPGHVLDARQAQLLHYATTLYVGDLLEGWYQDWCLHARQRYQFMYLALLDKLIGHSEAHHEYEAGIEYCAQVMNYDRAREHTHRQLMRLYSLAGDRSAALEQYARCAEILRTELDVLPDERTVQLYEHIRTGTFPNMAGLPTHDLGRRSTALAGLLARLEQTHSALAETQRQVMNEIESIRQWIAQNS